MTPRTWRVLLHVLGVAVGTATILLAVLVWRFSQGPVALDIAASRIESSFNEGSPEVRMEIGTAELVWAGWQELFGIRLHDVRLLDSSDRLFLEVREVVLDIAPDRLLRGEIRPQAASLVAPRIEAIRDEAGMVRIAPMDDPDGTAASMAWPALALDGNGTFSGPGNPVGRLLAAASEPPFGRLRTVRIVGAAARVDDRMLGLAWDIPALTVSISRQADGAKLEAAMALRSNGRLQEGIDLEAAWRSGAPGMPVSVRISGFAPAFLSDLVPSLGDLRGIDLTVDAGIDLAFDDSLELLHGSFRLDTEGGHVDLPGLFEQPFDLGPSRGRGVLKPGFSGFEVTDLEPGAGVEGLRAHIAVDNHPDGVVAEWGFELDELPVDDLGRYWPLVAGPIARTWLVEHLSEGVVRQASLSYSSTVAELVSEDPPTASLAVDLDVSGVTIEYLEGMPPVVGTDGHVAIADDTVRIETSGGTVGGLVADRGLIEMPRLDGTGGMRIGVDLHGPVAAALAVADHEPVAFAARTGFSPDSVSGSFEGSLEVGLAHLGGLTADDVHYRIVAEARELALTEDLGGYRLDGGTGTFKLDVSDTVVIEGDARLNDVPVAGSYHHALDPQAETARTFTLRGRLDNADRTALGMTDPFGIDGPVGLEVGMTEAANGTRTWTASADLLGAAVDVAEIGFGKEAGEPGHAALRLVESGGELAIENIEVSLAEAAMKGSGALHGDGLRLVRFDLEHLVFGRNDLAGTISAGDDDVFDIALSGRAVDLAAVFEDDDDGDEPELPPFRLRGQVDRVWMSADESMDDLRIEGMYGGDHWEALAVTGAITGGAPVVLDIWRVSPVERRFEYRSDSTGDTLRVFGGFDNVRGDAIRVHGWIDETGDEPVSHGVARTGGFLVRDAPVLARILSLASLVTIGDLLAGSGLEFHGAHVPYRQQGDVLTIRDARISGPGVGFTFAGMVDLGQDMLDIGGTMVPIYVANTLLEDVPLLGDILTGLEEGGGIFAFTFDVDGPLDDPDVTVNPLSILTPGILRSIFTLPVGEEAGTPSPEPPSGDEP